MFVLGVAPFSPDENLEITYKTHIDKLMKGDINTEVKKIEIEKTKKQNRQQRKLQMTAKRDFDMSKNENEKKK